MSKLLEQIGLQDMTRPVYDFSVVVTYMPDEKGETRPHRIWTGVNYNVTDKWLFIFFNDGQTLIMDSKDIKQINVTPIKTEKVEVED